MRYTVWAVFGVDADSPEQAKEIVTSALQPQTISGYRMDLFSKHNINPIVFVNPEFDKLIGMAIKKARKGG